MTSLRLITDTHEHRQQLDRVLSSKPFRRSKHLAPLLKFLVEETMGGRAALLSQSKIAEVFGHGNSFDPKLDSNARAMAGRLRVALQEYYNKEARPDEIRIEVPRGHYYVVADQAPVQTTQLRLAETKPDISIEDFKRFLTAMAQSEGSPSSELNQRLRRWLEYSTRFSASTLKAGDEFNSFFDYVARSGGGMSYFEMRDLTRFFGIHPLLLHPLASRPIQTDALTLSLTKDFTTVGEGDSPSYGKNILYSGPRTRLSDIETAIVQVMMGEGARSDSHQHPGDELMLVLEGAVELRLENSGIRIPLQKDDATQFYGEMTHSAANTSAKPARMLILRSRLSAARQQHIFGGSKAPSSSGPTDTKTTRQSGVAYSSNAEFGNKQGLARLLRTLPTPSESSLQEFLSELEAKSGTRYEALEPWLLSLETGEARAPRSIIEHLRLLYNIDDVLLYEFLFPAVPGAIVFRENDQEDQIDIGHITPAPPPPGVSYLIPRRSLAHSEITMSRLVLGPSMATRWSKHAGYDILVPLHGEGRVEFLVNEDESTSVSAKNGEIAEYNGRTTHRVLNPSSAESATLFLVRLHNH